MIVLFYNNEEVMRHVERESNVRDPCCRERQPDQRFQRRAKLYTFQSFVQADGINMQDAELPPGEYTVRVDIKDSEGRPGTTIFTLKVAPK